MYCQIFDLNIYGKATNILVYILIIGGNFFYYCSAIIVLRWQWNIKTILLEYLYYYQRYLLRVNHMYLY